MLRRRRAVSRGSQVVAGPAAVPAHRWEDSMRSTSIQQRTSGARVALVALVALVAPGIGAIPAQETPPAATESQPAPKAMTFVRIQAAEAAIRCFPTDRSPVFEDKLPQGTIVRVGVAEGLFHPIELPLGPIGYVHKRFTTTPSFDGDAAGTLATTGTEVSFRYRPRDGEAPVARLAKDAPLHWVGEDGDWWKVRAPGQVGYLAAADLEVLEGSDATAQPAFDQWTRARTDSWKESVAKHREAAVAKTQFAAITTQLDAVAAELARPSDRRDLAKADTDLAAVEAQAPTDDALRARITKLRETVDLQRKLQAVLSSTPVPDRSVETLIEPTPRGTLERYTLVGWMNARSGSGTDRFQLTKGGVPLANLSAAGGRYDLSLFDGYEVGIIGSLGGLQGAGIRTVQVERVEILSRPSSR